MVEDVREKGVAGGEMERGKEGHMERAERTFIFFKYYLNIKVTY